jgi:holo-[acyl-carrier protein] synthase
MIIGLGIDIIDIRRVERLLQEFGTRFTQRLFTATEIAKASRRADPAPTYAKRFAAKEACAKALGTGIAAGVFFRDMGVVNLPSGQPTLVLTGGALARVQQLTPPGMTMRLHLTITDEYPLAQAQVLLEAVAAYR